MPEHKFTLPKGTILRHKTGLIKSEERTYTIENVLGQGGFGITYLASSTISIGNTIHKVFFAIKEFFVQKQCYRENGETTMRFSPAAKEDVEECRKEFIAEARRLNIICHDTRNIVNVNEVFEANNTAYYVMEYLDGSNLRNMISQNGGALPEKKAIDFLLPIAEAISMIHEKHQLLHCDISPDNIMLRRHEDGTLEPVLIDFGESLHFNSKGNLTTTHTGQGVKDGFSPQEQYGGIKQFDPRIDVYALAATMYYLVVGRVPKSALEITPEDIENSLPSGLSASLCSAIKHGMEKNKKNRTTTVKDFIYELGAEEPPQPIIPDELPEGFIIKDNQTGYAYQIVSVAKKSSYYIHYKAVRHHGDDDEETSGHTKKESLDMYEFFDAKTHERNEDRTISTHGNSLDSETLFVNLCKDKTRGAITNTFTPGTDYGWHTFDANATHYLTLTHKRKPLPWEKIMNRASSIGKVVLGVAAVAVGIYLLVLGWNAASDYFKKKSEAKEKEHIILSQSLTRAIEQNNPDSLRYFAVEKDSARAYAPYAAICLEKGDTATAKMFAEKAGSNAIAARILAEINENGTKLASQEEPKTPQTKDENTPPKEDAQEAIYQKYLLQAQQAYRNGNNQASQNYLNIIRTTLGNSFYNKNEVQTLLSKIEARIKKEEQEKTQKEEQDKVNRQCLDLYNKANTAYASYQRYGGNYLDQADNYIKEIEKKSSSYAQRSEVRLLKENIRKSKKFKDEIGLPVY